MLETTLNAFWFALAATAFLIAPRRSRQAGVALFCALALLFPIISITDDLSFDRETLERAVAVLVELVMLVAIFITLGRLEWRSKRRPVLLLLGPSDPRSPPGA